MTTYTALLKQGKNLKNKVQSVFNFYQHYTTQSLTHLESARCTKLKMQEPNFSNKIDSLPSIANYLNAVP